MKVFRFSPGNEDLLRVGDIVVYVTMLTNRWLIRSFPRPGMVSTIPKTRLRETTWPYENSPYDFRIDNLLIPQGLLARRERPFVLLPHCHPVQLFPGKDHHP
jgi:hypothetical protein